MTFIGVSNWITNKVLKDGINGENEVKTIYNGINTSVFYKKDKKQMRDLLGLPQDKKIIISLAGSGSKTNAKGLGYVQQVIKAYEHHPDYLFLTLGNAKETRVSSSLLEL
jgi:glycogen synthase